jgi:hypothetical protein
LGGNDSGDYCAARGNLRDGVIVTLLGEFFMVLVASTMILAIIVLLPGSARAARTMAATT